MGNGPPPTRVEYAFTTPSTLLIHRPGTPEPLGTPTPELLLLVTNGKGAVIDVQQCALGAFEQDSFAGFDGVEQIRGGVGDVGLQPSCVAAVFGVDGRRIERAHARFAGEAGQLFVFGFDDVVDALAEGIAVQIAQPHGVGLRRTLSL